MLYRAFQDLKLSALGFGLMRLPVLDKDNSRIDYEAAQEMIHYAMAHGVNYYDTAYAYHEGQSERFIGQVMKDYPRKDYYLASKFPGYEQAHFHRKKEIFEEQLAKCQTDYFDFYLMHSVSDSNIEWYMDDELGLADYLLSEKKAGRIRHLGFSTHSSLENLERFLEKYHAIFEFGQVQVNWIDWSYQDAKIKMDLLKRYHIPVWVMEPLRGGYLAKLSDQEKEEMQAIRPGESIAAMSFRYIQQFDQVGVTLSGMSNLDQVKENIKTFSDFRPLTPEENDQLMGLAFEKIKSLVVPCTACQYCVPECPVKLEIPALMKTYNALAFEDGVEALPESLKKKGEAGDPNRCIACHACEKKCPQSIPIAETNAKLAEKAAAQKG